MTVGNYTTESLEKQLDLIHELIGLVQNGRQFKTALQEDKEMMMLLKLHVKIFNEKRNRILNK